MPDSLDSQSTASTEEGGSCITEEESYYTPSPNTLIDLEGDAVTMSCLTMHRRTKSSRDLNNRWVLLNKDTFQEILNATLNQMTGAGGGGSLDAQGQQQQQEEDGDDGDIGGPHTSPARPQGACIPCSGSPGASRGSQSPSQGRENKTTTAAAAVASKTSKAHSKSSEEKTGNAKKAKGGVPGGRTIIASSDIRKQQLRVVSRINFKDGGKVVTPAEKKAAAKSAAAAGSPSPRNSGAPTGAAQRKHSSNTSSKRSKVVCRASNKAVPTDPRAGPVDSAPGSSGAHGSPESALAAAANAASASTAHRPIAVEKEPKDGQSSTQSQAGNMSVVAVANSPTAPVSGTGTVARASSGGGSSPVHGVKMKVPAGQERWVPVSKSTLFDLVEELVARKLGDDSPMTSDGARQDDNTRPRTSGDNSNATTDSANRPGTSKDSVSDRSTAASGGNSTNNNETSKLRAGTSESVSKDNSSRSMDQEQNSSSNDKTGPSSPGRECWVALNKTVVIDVMDEAIRHLDDDENTGNGDSGEAREVAMDGSRSIRNQEPTRLSAEVSAQVETAATADESRSGGSAAAQAKCPQASARAASPPTNTPQLSKLFPGPTSLELAEEGSGHLGNKSKKRGLEESESGSRVVGIKRKRSDSGPSAVSIRPSEMSLPTNASGVHKALSLAASTRDTLLTAAIFSQHAQREAAAAGNVAALRSLFVPGSDPALRFASPAESSIRGVSSEPNSGSTWERVSPSGTDKTPLTTSRQCNVIDLRPRTLAGDASAAEISPFSRRVVANQSAPTDSDNNDAIAIKLDGRATDGKMRNNPDRYKGTSEGGKKEARSARDSPETTWVAVSKTDVNSIVDCVVSTMITDDDTVTSPARADDTSTRSASPRSSSCISESSRDVDDGGDDSDDVISAENVPPPVDPRYMCAQVLATDLHQSRTVGSPGQRTQSLAREGRCGRTETLASKPASRSNSPSAHAKENAFDYPSERGEDSLSDEAVEEGDCEEPRKAFKWKSSLMRRVREESGTGVKAGRGGPTGQGRPRSHSDPGSKNAVPSPKDGGSKQDRRCSKRVSSKRRHHRTVLSAK